MPAGRPQRRRRLLLFHRRLLPHLRRPRRRGRQRRNVSRVAGEQGRNQGKDITEKQYVEQCRTGAAMAAPAPAPAAPPSPAPRDPHRRPLSPRRRRPPRLRPAVRANIKRRPRAKGRCPADTVVWMNLKSKVYHFAGAKNYGTTKEGAYMCERRRSAQGDRASKSEHHP